MRRPMQAWTDERRAQARELYERGDSLAEIAVALGTNCNRAAKAIRAAGGTLRRRGAPMERNGFWRGGRTVDVDGYILLKVQDHPGANRSGYVREHRLVMEQVLGRHLRPEEVVHHKNGDPADNRPENLELFESNAKHLAHELAGRCPNWSPEGRAAIRAMLDRRTANAQPKTREEKNALAREWYAARKARLRSSTDLHPRTDEPE